MYDEASPVSTAASASAFWASSSCFLCASKRSRADGVALLPRLTLLVVAGQPLLGLGVEAVGVDVVALVVVLGLHAVLRRVEGVLGERALVGLLQRQRDAATLEVDVDDLDQQLVADVDDLLRDLDVALGQLGDVHQALDAVLDADERAERNQLGDLARHDLADLVGAGELAPRVFLGRLERQRDALAVEVDVEHLDGDLLADLDDLGRVVDVLPGQLGDVHQTVDAAEVDERAEVDDRADTTPVRTWPLASLFRNSLRTSDWVCSSHARRDSTTLLRFLSSSMILASSVLPT